MANCTYTIKGRKFSSYTDLLGYIDELAQTGALELNGVDDIVYSKSPRMEAQVQKLRDLKASYTTKADTEFNVSQMINGEPESNNSIINFLDSPKCAIEGRPLVTPLNRENYIKSQVENLVQERGISEEEAVKIVENILENWKRIQEDSLILHQMFTSKEVISGTDVDFISRFQDEIPDSLRSTSLLIQLHDSLRKVYYREKKKYVDCTAISGINLSSKLKDDAQELIGHIDQMFIGKDGTLHLYLYKTSSTHPKEWKGVKEEKYKYQLAFLKQMLANNGIDVTNIDLNIIPVQLTYNEDFSKVQEITVHYPESYSTRKTSNMYAMHKYDRDAKYFLGSNVSLRPITDQFIKRIDEINKAIFPSLNIKYEGIAKSARQWILTAPDVDPEGVEPLVIKEIGDIDHYYDVIINGKTYPIKTRKGKNTNPEIQQLVEEHLKELTDNLGYSTQRLKDAILESYKRGYNTLETKKGIMGKADNIMSALSKYITPNRDKDDKITGYDWELMDNLIDSNVLIFRNTKTNSIDIITLSTFDLNQKAHFSKGDTVLGNYLRKSEYIDLESNYGNIELIRTLSLINEIIPQLGDVRLGNVGVLSAVGEFPYIQHNIGEFSKKYYYKVIQTVNKEVGDIKIQNNFNKAEFISDLEYLTREYLNIVESKDNTEKGFYEQLGFGELENIDGKEHHVKVEALRHILQQIQSTYAFDNLNYYNSVKNQSNKTGQIARLYDLVAKAYFSLTGGEVVRNTEYNNIEGWFVTPNTQANQNIQFVVNGLQITYDTIASEFNSIYDKDIRSIFTQYYDAIGYSAAQNMTIGNQASQFSNLYDKETMTFKNPYDISNNLTKQERELLKKALYQIAKITTKGNFNISPYNDQEMSKYIENHPDYLWVPLEKASKATSRSSIDRSKARIRNGFNRLKKINERFDEYVNGITQEERDLIGNDSDEFYTFSLKNPFQVSMLLGGSYSDVKKSRQKLLSKYGSDYFETNLENILIDYLVKSIQTEQLQKFMTVSKAFLLRMHLTGDMGGNRSVVEKEIKYIENYLKVNVFSSSIMSKQEKAVISTIMPVRNFATNVLVGGNVIAYVRDTIQGLEANFVTAYTKLNTDIDRKSVAAAYAYVTKHATSNAMAVNLLGKLCLQYRLSNTDVGRIAERAKSGRNGILNYDNWLYGTLRSPDFMNRMVLFVAKCMHDGVWDAYSVDKDNNLIYNWKEDKRFSVYASRQTTHPEYSKQKSLYFSKIKEYNEEHPDKPLEFTDDLLSPYSQREIMAIRAVGDNIYGAYDKSKRAMAESHSLGICFGMFTTWMNGIVNTYLMKPQKNGISKLLEEQEIDENGNLLWFNEDGSTTTENTGVPVLKFVPPIVMGVFPSIGILASMCKEKGFKAAWDYMQSNPVMKANMRKILSDLLISLLMLALFKLALDPAYKEHKKEAADNPAIQNLVTEILYKGSAGSYDIFKGLYNVVGFVGNNNATPIYSVPAQLLHNTWSFVTDDKDLGTIFTTNTGIGRSFKDTYKLYKSSQE